MSNNQMPTVQSATAATQKIKQVEAMEAKRKVTELVKTILIIVISLVAVAFIGLFIWTLVRYNDASTDLDKKISDAVAIAEEKQALELEKEFAEREKNPYKTFSGPADYGELTFEYPRTWSVYIASDASKGGDFDAYFNPIEVNPISDETVDALRLTIRDTDFESVAKEYQKALEARNSNLSVESITIFNGTAANRYSGTIPKTELNGYIVIFKIRDKTAVLRTDSVLFEEDFNRVLETISFNS